MCPLIGGCSVKGLPISECFDWAHQLLIRRSLLGLKDGRRVNQKEVVQEEDFLCVLLCFQEFLVFFTKPTSRVSISCPRELRHVFRDDPSLISSSRGRRAEEKNPTQF